MNGDDVARPHGTFVPAEGADRGRASRLSGPMGNVALVVFHIEHEHGVRVGPHEFRHGGLLQDNYFVRLVRRAPVVRERRATNR